MQVQKGGRIIGVLGNKGNLSGNLRDLGYKGNL
jgi:hypothetical protein